MVGGELTVPVTAIANGARAAVEGPSVTLITIWEKVPALVGVPDNRPVLVLKDAHAGWPEIENVNVRPDGPVALGVKE